MSHGLQGYSSQVTTHYSYFLKSFEINMPSLSLSTAKHSVRRIFDKSLRNSTAKSAMNTSFCLSVTFLEREKKNCLSHVKCDATALIHECVELRCLFITFPTHLQRERMKLCMSKSPLQISTTKLAVME